MLKYAEAAIWVTSGIHGERGDVKSRLLWNCPDFVNFRSFRSK